MNITLKQLRIFATLARTAHIGHAADSLFLTKPAVSMALKELEKQLQVDLFERLPNSLKLNANGERLLPLADELLSRSNEIETLFEAEHLSGELTIGCSKTIGNHLMPKILASFRQTTGHTRQQLNILNSRDVCKLVASYELDLGLIEASVCLPGQSLALLRQDKMVIIAAPDHPLCKQSKLPISALDQQNWVLREDGSGSRALFQQAVSPHLNLWQITLELNEPEAIINSVAAGLGLSCLSELAANDAISSGKVAVLDMAAPLHRPFYLVYQDKKHQSPLFQAFIAHCKQVARE